MPAGRPNGTVLGKKSKAALIREKLAIHGWETSAKEIIDILKKEDVIVGVSNVSHEQLMHRNPARLKVENPVYNRQPKNPEPKITIDDLKRIKSLKDRIGSFTQLKQLLQDIEAIGGFERFKEGIEILQNLTK
jgi:hypothetical protein